MTPLTTVTIHSKNADQTEKLGEMLGALLEPGDTVLLYGELGAGKTTLARGICHGLGLEENIPVRSPTFTMIHEYRGRTSIRHVDLYRIDDPAELETIGLFDSAFEGVTIIEWAEKLEEEKYSGTVYLKIADISEKERKIEIEAVADFFRKTGAKTWQSLIDGDNEPC